MSRSPEPYVAVALQPSFKGIRHRDEIMENIRNLSLLIDVAMWMSETELPIRLVAIPEGVLQGFPDEIFDMSHAEYLEAMAIDIPGRETDELAKKARQYGIHIICQARGTDAKIPGYYFNWAFIIGPDGNIIHKAAKHQVYYKEPSTTPHDVLDRWIEAHGNSLDAFFPVTETELGRIGTLVCYEGSFPETARALAVNGAEIIYRGSYAEPWVGRGVWELQNRARALDNTCYVIAPNLGPGYLVPGAIAPVDVAGGGSMVIDYKGQLLGHHVSGSNSWTAGVVDIGALRDFRNRAGIGAWLKEMKSEIYQLIYKEPLYPKNFYADSPEKRHADRKENYQRAGAEMIRKGIWVK
jgi:predicted amidohydrolase